MVAQIKGWLLLYTNYQVETNLNTLTKNNVHFQFQ